MPGEERARRDVPVGMGREGQEHSQRHAGGGWAATLVVEEIPKHAVVGGAGRADKLGVVLCMKEKWWRSDIFGGQTCL